MLVTASQTAQPAPAFSQKATASEAPSPRSSNSAEQPRADSAAKVRSASTSAPAPQSSAQYRLVYDQEFSRTFVQVVDRDSGEEILRFPPEQLIRFIDSNIERNSSGSAAGLLVDRSV